MELEHLVQGKNSVLLDFGSCTLLYEKLSSTIHCGKRDKLEDLQGRVEALDYGPSFETESLRRLENKPLGVLFLEATEQCNLGCSYCIYSDDYPYERQETPREMAFATAKKAIDDLAPLSGHNLMIGFYGGEPSLNMDLVRGVIRYSRGKFPNKELDFSMTTNFFDVEEYIPEIVDEGIYINLSLDGPEGVHDKSRRTKGGKPTYQKIRENLRKMEDYFPGYTDSHVFVLSTCEDPNDLQEIVDFFEEGEFFVTHINSPDPKGRISSRTRIPGNSSGYDLADKFVQRILVGEDPKVLRRLFDQDLKSVAVRDMRLMPSELMLNGSCYPGKKRVFVDVGGDYHPCERFGHRLTIGSVEEGILDEFIEKTIESFAQIRNELCKTCWAQRMCTPCMQHAKDPEGEISVKGLSEICEGKKRQLMIVLRNYIYLVQSDKERVEAYVASISPSFERGLI
ncbi:MAG: radical SAM protein [Nanoarchaeota archaeon]|nr:radical SAM protein [Nanoarchaeota archaeon]